MSCIGVAVLAAALVVAVMADRFQVLWVYARSLPNASGVQGIGDTSGIRNKSGTLGLSDSLAYTTYVKSDIKRLISASGGLPRRLTQNRSLVFP
jgi:hypothetical protein